MKMDDRMAADPSPGDLLPFPKSTSKADFCLPLHGVNQTDVLLTLWITCDSL